MSAEEYKKVLRYLRRTYPKCFVCPPVPLATGIKGHLKILELKKAKSPITRENAQYIFKRYTKWKMYLGALKEGANRYNLDGTVQKQVSEKHATDVVISPEEMEQYKSLNTKNKQVETQKGEKKKPEVAKSPLQPGKPQKKRKRILVKKVERV